MIKLLGISCSRSEILLGRDRIKYIEKHKRDFNSEDDFRKHIESLPEIIQNPDYVGLHSDRDSIRFIKKIDEHMLVAVRLTGKDKLWVRSAYPITQAKLDYYINKGYVIKCTTPLD
ncbi:hypothetical protein B0537_03475 [Desulforamulus ferrireducens]|uniref:Phage-Barnase-EndoU-ColicinE5/D-RelE like nuclease 3 domain-containing protein n=1 Tax=Desulforamulus ferrireducens TaxID=1833852 RepID=A0A1S6ITX8_9FIRM|nr:hypothetical protein B0537_03475 [Desulforamulus ferrireducens]